MENRDPSRGLSIFSFQIKVLGANARRSAQLPSSPLPLSARPNEAGLIYLSDQRVSSARKTQGAQPNANRNLNT